MSLHTPSIAELKKLIAKYEEHVGTRPGTIRLTRAQYNKLMESFPAGTLIKATDKFEPMFDGIKIEIFD